MALPPAVRSDFGFALWLAQAGDQADGIGVLEVVENDNGGRIGPSIR